MNGEGHRAKCEMEKYHRKLEDRRWTLARGVSVNRSRTHGGKYSTSRVLKLHSKAAGVERHQNCETGCGIPAAYE